DWRQVAIGGRLDELLRRQQEVSNVSQPECRKMLLDAAFIPPEIIDEGRVDKRDRAGFAVLVHSSAKDQRRKSAERADDDDCPRPPQPPQGIVNPAQPQIEIVHPLRMSLAPQPAVLKESGDPIA